MTIDSISSNNNVSSLAPNGMEGNYLTPDALMTYCQTRLRGLDDQMQAAFADQQRANKTSTDLSNLQQKLNELIGSASSLTVVHGGQASNDITIKNLADQLLKAANASSDPSVAKALADKARVLVAVSGDPPACTFNPNQDVLLPAKEYSSADIKGMTSDCVASIQKDLNSGTELSMINLQSLMSQRQSSVQLITNMVQSLGDQLNKIASNIGH